MSRKEISDKILDKFESKFETIQIISIETMSEYLSEKREYRS